MIMKIMKPCLRARCFGGACSGGGATRHRERAQRARAKEGQTGHGGGHPGAVRKGVLLPQRHHPAGTRHPLLSLMA